MTRIGGLGASHIDLILDARTASGSIAHTLTFHKTSYLIEQNRQAAMDVSNRLLVMERGQIIEESETESIADLKQVRRLIVLRRT